jgi:hypothetical protein
MSPPPRVEPIQGKGGWERTALVSVLVTGTVGIIGVIASWQSSRDSQETARATQREAANRERQEADLAELRSVFDRATADLERQQAVIIDLLQPVQRDRANRASDRRRVRAVVRRVETSRARIRIRLGTSDASREYSRALRRYRAAGIILTYPDGPTARRLLEDAGLDTERFTPAELFDAAESVAAEGKAAAGRFIAEAQELVGSQLPKREAERSR